jgi:hypothetical protein
MIHAISSMSADARTLETGGSVQLGGVRFEYPAAVVKEGSTRRTSSSKTSQHRGREPSITCGESTNAQRRRAHADKFLNNHATERSCIERNLSKR